MNNYHTNLITELTDKYTDINGGVLIPPPVFLKMKGNVSYYCKDKKEMKITFPVLDEYLNPYGNMQGGMLAAAIDNTFGPLSMLMGDKSYTRNLEIKYKKPVSKNNDHIVVEAKVQEINKDKIILKAYVKSEYGEIMAVSTAINWVINDL